MAKICSFCNAENAENEEFCAKCGAKLPVYHKFADDPDFEDTPKKVRSINFRSLLFFVIVLAFLTLLGFAFYPAFPDEPIPEPAKYNAELNNVFNTIKDIKPTDDNFRAYINCSPETLSLFLTSLSNPEALKNDKPTRFPSPRFIVITDKDPQRFSIVFHEKVIFFNIRVQMFFEGKDQKWQLKNYKIGNLYATGIGKDWVFDKFFKRFAEHALLKNVINADIKIQRSRSKFIINISKGSVKAKVF